MVAGSPVPRTRRARCRGRRACRCSEVAERAAGRGGRSAGRAPRQRASGRGSPSSIALIRRCARRPSLVDCAACRRARAAPRHSSRRATCAARRVGSAGRRGRCGHLSRRPASGTRAAVRAAAGEQHAVAQADDAPAKLPAQAARRRRSCRQRGQNREQPISTSCALGGGRRAGVQRLGVDRRTPGRRTARAASARASSGSIPVANATCSSWSARATRRSGRPRARCPVPPSSPSALITSPGGNWKVCE